MAHPEPLTTASPSSSMWVHDMIPHELSTIEAAHYTWVGRVMDQLRTDCQKGLEKYELLADVAAMNYTLFYEVLINNLVELAPIVYVSVVCCTHQGSRAITAAAGPWMMSSDAPIAWLQMVSAEGRGCW